MCRSGSKPLKWRIVASTICLLTCCVPDSMWRSHTHDHIGEPHFTGRKLRLREVRSAGQDHRASVSRRGRMELGSPWLESTLTTADACATWASQKHLNTDLNVKNEQKFSRQTRRESFSGKKIREHFVSSCLALLSSTGVVFYTNWRQEPPPAKRLSPSLYCDTCFTAVVWNRTRNISEAGQNGAPHLWRCLSRG